MATGVKSVRKTARLTLRVNSRSARPAWSRVYALTVASGGGVSAQVGRRACTLR
jgi:hypothetical protein